MDQETRQAIDATITALIDGGQHDEAIKVAIERYGPGIFGMFMGVFHDEAVAQDVFQHFSLELWKSMPSFEGRSRFYTWAYRIARRAISRRFERTDRREQRLHTQQESNLPAQWTRTATAEWRRTETRNRFQEMCAQLEPDERTLVMLRIDQEMPWKEIAAVLAEGEQETPTPEALQKEAAALRKRFERIKLKLREAMGQP